ncbi:MAG: orotate phosphoribosyltransferase [Planctomycetes bacterium]|nr:orotate phosphoribosyltransferase [Planctomycetota bacterium]
MDDVRARLREKLAGCIKTGRITLSSGKVTDFYFDGRLVSLDPEGSALLGELFLEEVKARGIEAVGGLTSGADPITSAIGVLAWQKGVPLKLFFVRKERKGHGTQKMIEGPPLRPDESAPPPATAIVDDVLTTGGSLLKARDALVEEAGVRPAVAMVIVDRQEGGEEKLREEGIELVALFRRSDFL